jgi:hypothetical protein
MARSESILSGAVFSASALPSDRSVLRVISESSVSPVLRQLSKVARALTIWSELRRSMYAADRCH